MSFTFLYNSEYEALAQNTIVPKIADNIGDVSPLMGKLVGDGNANAGHAKPNAKLQFTGGAKVEKVVRVAHLTARGSQSGHGVVNVNPNRTHNNAVQSFARYYATISITREEASAVRGPEAKVNLMETKVSEAIASIKDLIANGIFNADDIDLTGDELYGMNGLGQLCGKRGTLISTGAAGNTGGGDRSWMGIDSTANTYWDTASWDSSINTTQYLAADLLDSTSASYIQDIIRSQVRAATVGNVRPDLIVTTKTVYNYLEQSMLVNQRFVDSSKGNLGFEQLAFEGIPVIWDAFCPEYHAYFLRTAPVNGQQSLGIMGRKGFWFDMTPWKQATNSLVAVRQIACDLNLYCDNPRYTSSLLRIGDA